MLPRPGRLAPHWKLDPEVVFLNHGSFGACPSAVLDAQTRWRAHMEAEMVRFHVCEYDAAMDAARDRLAAFIRADAAGLTWVANATQAVATVLRNVRLSPGDELLVNDHEYSACVSMFERAAGESGAHVVVASMPFPVRAEEDVVDAILSRVGPRTRLALVSLTTSPSALVLPVATLVRELRARGVETMLDAAHGPGFVELHVGEWGAAYTCGNFHKWTCAPKGSAFLHVREDLRRGFEPLAISSRAKSARPDRSRFHLLSDYLGTDDPTPWLASPAALDFLASQHPAGWPGVMAANRELALRARDRLCAALGAAPPAPDTMVGAMAAVPLPGDARAPIPGVGYPDPLWRALVERWRIQVPIVTLPGRSRVVRISAQLYNSDEQYEYLGRALRAELGISDAAPAASSGGGPR